MDPFGNDEIARLLRLKRYEQLPPAYFENFLSEFRRRQRDELLRQLPWRICFERAQGFAVQYNVRSLASYAAGIAAVVACVAVISITIYQQPALLSCSREHASSNQVIEYRKRIGPSRLGFLIPTCNGAPTFLRASSRDIIPLLPADPTPVR